MFTRPEELSTYNRHWLPPKISRTRSFAWQFVYTSEVNTFARVRLRLFRIDGEAPVWVGDWIKPTTRYVDFPTVAPDDDYFVGWPEIQGGGDIALAQPLIVNSTGKALPVRRPWTAFDRFDLGHNYAGQGFDQRMVAQIAVGKTIAPAPTYPLKPRTFMPIVNPADQAKMYVRRVGLHTFYKHPDIFEVPTPGAAVGEGDVACSRGMNYFYDEMVSYDGKPNGLLPPIPPIRDGPRGFCTIPATAKFINRRGGAGTFGISTLGSFYFLNGEYKRTTLGGWRLKPGMLPPHPSYRLTDTQWYVDHYDFVGDTALMGAGWRPSEFWSFVVAEAFDPGNTHDFWMTATMSDEICQLNHWTAHPPAEYKPTPFPPPGYTSPAAPTGQATWMPFIRNHPLCKQPWGIAAHPKQAKFWYTNYDSGGAKANPGGGGFIARCNRTAATIDALEIEAVHKPPAVPDYEIGVGARLHDAQIVGSWGMIAQNDAPDVLCGTWFGVPPSDLAATADGDLTINGVPIAGLPAAPTAAKRAADLAAAINAVSARSRVSSAVVAANAYTIAFRGGVWIARIGWTDREMVVQVRDMNTENRTGLRSVVRKMYVVDGPLDSDGKGNGASCLHPQDCGFLSDGTFVWAERYPYVIRCIPPDGSGVRTLAKIRPVEFAATSSGDNDISLSIDDQDRIYIRAWNRNLVFTKDGTKLGVFGGTLAQGLPPGQASKVSPGDYGWAAAANEGHIPFASNAGHTMHESSQMQPGDAIPDQALRTRGYNAMLWGGKKSMAITHGAYGENTIGGHNVESLGAYSDDALADYFARVIGIPETVTIVVDGKEQQQHPVTDAVGYVRSRTTDYVYPQPLLAGPVDSQVVVVPPQEEDPAVIKELQAQVAALTSDKAMLSSQLQDTSAQLQTAQQQAALATERADTATAHASDLQRVVDLAAQANVAITGAASRS